MSGREIYEFSTPVQLAACLYPVPSVYFWRIPWLMQPIKTGLICLSLISFQLGGVDVQLRGSSGELSVRGELLC